MTRGWGDGETREMGRWGDKGDKGDKEDKEDKGDKEGIDSHQFPILNS
ncbi:MAG: hypothetical protein F6J86_09350 [Symploca sp. SIO1B1]|nr:hypothetical protein [Symploca sp. SIO1B1]